MTAIAARALALFDEYAELPAAERERRLAALAAAEPELHAALRALLRADADEDAGVLDRSPARILAERHLAERDLAGRRAREAGDARDAGAPAPAPPDLRVGARLGAWRIDRIIGRGGMGTVYEAHRDDGQYQQRVALKCVRAELDSPRLVAAMREERNLLARLDHPGIAALVDGGVDADGHPWFALRYVEGEPIDAWCDRRGLDTGARVDLLLQVCDAVAYAHAQGVLHRDIKPSNILVAGDGRAQLLDFGISSQIGPLREAQPDLAALTPHYAAPEARAHGAQGPAADLYALGVLTYRLLCGRWPTPLHGLRPLLRDPDSGAAQPMARLLEDADDACARARGAADAAALARRLRGDLSAVALKAVAGRAQDRYASVAEFADELRRWRQGRPVRARPRNALARAGMWLRRNPMAAGLSAALILAAGAGAGAAWWQHRQALRGAEANEQVGRLFASTLGSATLSGLSDTRFSSRSLLERSERELRALPLSDQPALRAHALATLARGYHQVGDYRRAARLAEEAQTVAGDSIDNDEDGFVAATRMATLNYQGRAREAMAFGQARLDRLDGHDNPALIEARIAIGLELAEAAWTAGRTRQALERADQLLRLASASARNDLIARTLILRSGFLRSLGRLARAEADAQRALALARALDASLADDALERLVDVQRVRLSPNYAETARMLLDERRRNLGPDHPQTALAEVYSALSRFPDVPREQALATLARLEAGYGRGHPVYALSLSRLAWTAARDRTEELRMQREAVATLQRARPDSEMLLNARANLARVLFGRGYADAPDFAGGVELLRLNIADRVRLGLPTVNDQLSLSHHLATSGGDRRLPLAQRTVDDALRAAPDFYKPADVEWLILRVWAAVIDYRQGRRERADARFGEVLDDLDKAPASSGLAENWRDDLRMMALTYRGVYAFGDCRRTEAAGFMREAVALVRSRKGSGNAATMSDVLAFDRELRAGRLPARAPFVAPEESHGRPGAAMAGAPHRCAAGRGETAATGASA